jgi:hypothetical protein
VTYHQVAGEEHVVAPSTTSAELPIVAPSDAALDDAGRLIFEARRIRDSLPVEEAARRAVRPGGPPYEELVDQIRAQRLRRPKASAA